MSLSKLASGRWGAQVHDPATGHNVRVSKILGDDYVTSTGAIGSRSFRTKSEAKTAREDARARLSAPRGGLTIAEWATRWTTDPLFARPKRSTDLHNAERIKEFVTRYGDVPLTATATDRGDAIVGEWLAGGRHNSTIGALRVFFNDAMSAKAGRLLTRNPFAGLGIAQDQGQQGQDTAEPRTDGGAPQVRVRADTAVVRRLPGVRMRLGLSGPARSTRCPGRTSAGTTTRSTSASSGRPSSASSTPPSTGPTPSR
jgi:hypothetical protein